MTGQLISWIESANLPDTDFPVENLPFGAFSTGGNARCGVAIGDQILDVSHENILALLSSASRGSASLLAEPVLNSFMQLPAAAVKSLRGKLADLLCSTDRVVQSRAGKALIPIASARMHLPVRIGDYTDFYASIEHATNVGRLFRPDNPLLPNYKHVPIGYHGRASSIVVSGTPFKRPSGQTKPANADKPIFGPSRSLDYEAEVGFFIGRGNDFGTPVPIDQAEDHIFGFCLVNDWSARDIQAWEYQPLGPFLAKNFATSISPWIVTLDALKPFRAPGPPRAKDDPEPLAYLRPTGDGALRIQVEVFISSKIMRDKKLQPVKLSHAEFQKMYWTPAQMLAHHTSGGCNLQPGDLLASGTVSGSTPDSLGCLLELTKRGAEPIELPTGEKRKFLEDGDEVILKAFCESASARRIGFGECRGTVLASA